MAEPTTDPAQPRSALDVLFDLRVIIALLFAIYGLVCLVWGLAFTDAEQLSKSGGIHLNLWAGIGMLAMAAKPRPVDVRCLRMVLLGQFQPGGRIDHQRHMHHPRQRQPQQAAQHALARRGTQQVGAAHHVGHALRRIVDHHR